MSVSGLLNEQPPRPEQMNCMEVWGGNTAIDKWFELPGLNAWVFSDPHGTSAGGGDVYYISSCASGRITRTLLADVSGHGEGASDIALGLRELMRDHVNLVRQSKFVRAVNREFTDLEFTGKFATAVIATYFAPRRSYEFCAAGHPPPLLYRTATETWTILDTANSTPPDHPPSFPLGIDAATKYAQHTVILNHGDAVLTYSDSVIESAAAAGGLLMTEGLLDIVRSTSMSQPERFITQLVATLRDIAAGNLTADDTTIMLCQATDSKPSLKDNLLAPLRLLQRASDNTTLAGLQ